MERGFTGEPEVEGCTVWVSVFFTDQMTQDGVCQKERAGSGRGASSSTSPEELGPLISERARTHAALFVI